MIRIYSTSGNKRKSGSDWGSRRKLKLLKLETLEAEEDTDCLHVVDTARRLEGDMEVQGEMHRDEMYQEHDLFGRLEQEDDLVNDLTSRRNRKIRSASV